MNTYIRTIVTALTLLFNLVISAQSDFFQVIEQNNLRLKAIREANKASVSEKLSENTLGVTTVEYSPFYIEGVHGMASSELIVSQEFDFPTIYAARSKSARLTENLLSQEYLLACREVFYEAGNLYYDLLLAHKMAQILQQRNDAADSLLSVAERRMAQGLDNVLDVNRIRLERMTLQTSMVENEGLEKRLMIQLKSMGWNVELPYGDTLSLRPLANVFDEVAAGCARLTLAQHEVALQKQNWLPKLTLGYRRNTELLESRYNGFLVGASIPLFSNSRKVKAARDRAEAAEQELAATRREKESRQMEIIQKKESLLRVLATYDIPLMYQSLELLLKATLAGEKTISDYYMEVDRIYAMLQNYHSTQTEYNKVILQQSLNYVSQ